MRIHGLNIHTRANPHRPRFREPNPPPLDFYRPFPDAHLPKLEQAIVLLVRKAANNANCTAVFRASGHGHTLQELLAGNDIWLSYNPMVDGDPALEGAPAPSAFAHEKEILLFEPGMKYDPLVLASVLAHELDHVNGVGGAFSPLNRYAHGMADHAALNCVGVLSPPTQLLNELSAYGVKCKTCMPLPSLVDPVTGRRLR